MTHTQILLRELSLHRSTTYRELMQKYGDQGYTYDGFVCAVRQLIRKGLVEPRKPRERKPITITGCCPYCGRTLEVRDETV